MGTTASVNLDPFGRRQGEPRKDVLAGSVTAQEKLDIIKILAAAGFENMSDGVRTVLFAYRDLPEIRAMVERWRTQNPEG